MKIICLRRNFDQVCIFRVIELFLQSSGKSSCIVSASWQFYICVQIILRQTLATEFFCCDALSRNDNQGIRRLEPFSFGSRGTTQSIKNRRPTLIESANDDLTIRNIKHVLSCRFQNVPVIARWPLRPGKQTQRIQVRLG